MNVERQLTLLRMAARVDPHFRQAVEDVEAEFTQLRESVRIADHIVTRLGNRPAAGGDYRGYAWAQAEAELSVLIDQYKEAWGQWEAKRDD